MLEQNRGATPRFCSIRPNVRRRAGGRSSASSIVATRFAKILRVDAAPTVTLAPWTGPWAEDDPDANFKADVAAHGRLDPLTTIVALADNLGIPVGGLVRAILGRWAAEGSSALLELGEPMVRRMATIVDEATAAGTDDARLDAYRRLAGLVGWLVAGLDDPAAYPDPVER